jgi:hypothetical protein
MLFQKNIFYIITYKSHRLNWENNMSLSNQDGVKLLKEAASQLSKLSPQWPNRPKLDPITRGGLDFILKTLEPIWSSPENQRPPGLDATVFLRFIRHLREIGPKSSWSNHVEAMHTSLQQMITKLER